MSNSIVIAAADTTNVRATSVTPSWILAGKPETRAQQLSSSKDRNSYTMVWDCTAGNFNWYYSLDETLVVLEGEAFIKSDGLGGSGPATSYSFQPVVQQPGVSLTISGRSPFSVTRYLLLSVLVCVRGTHS